MVIGMDWLEACGPMMVDWLAKTLEFQHEGQQVRLQGLQGTVQRIEPVSFAQVEMWEQIDSIAHVVWLYSTEQQKDPEELPLAIQDISEKFSGVFAEPSKLPPQKPWDHAIALLPGAQPVNIRSY